MVKSSKDQSLDEALADIDAKWGKGSIFRLAEAPDFFDVESLSTGILPLDLVLGVRAGIPRGRITEVFGPPMSGKTTLVLTTIAKAQQDGKICAFIDAENALDIEYARVLGVDVDSLIISQPITGEEAFYSIDKLCRTGQVAIIAIDSVAALLPKSMIEGDFGDAFVGMHPRFLSQSVPKILSPAVAGNTALIFINQLRESIGKSYGPTEYRPGGRAVPYYSSCGLDVRRIQTIKDPRTDEPMANRTKVKVIKHKTGIPYKTCEFDIEYGIGVPRENCLVDLGLQHGLIKQSASWFADAKTGEKLGQGKAKVTAYLRENPDFADEIEREILEANAA